jgi:hypothetical protein
VSSKGGGSSPVHGGSHINGFKMVCIFAKVEFVRICVEYVYESVTIKDLSWTRC